MIFFKGFIHFADKTKGITVPSYTFAALTMLFKTYGLKKDFLQV